MNPHTILSFLKVRIHERVVRRIRHPIYAVPENSKQCSDYYHIFPVFFTPPVNLRDAKQNAADKLRNKQCQLFCEIPGIDRAAHAKEREQPCEINADFRQGRNCKHHPGQWNYEQYIYMG